MAAVVNEVALKWHLTGGHCPLSTVPVDNVLCPLFSLLWTLSWVTFLLVDNVKWIGLCCPALNLLLTSVCANEMVSRNLPTSCSKIVSDMLILIKFWTVCAIKKKL